MATPLQVCFGKVRSSWICWLQRKDSSEFTTKGKCARLAESMVPGQDFNNWIKTLPRGVWTEQHFSDSKTVKSMTLEAEAG